MITTLDNETNMIEITPFHFRFNDYPMEVDKWVWDSAVKGTGKIVIAYTDTTPQMLALMRSGYAEHCDVGDSRNILFF